MVAEKDTFVTPQVAPEHSANCSGTHSGLRNTPQIASELAPVTAPELAPVTAPETAPELAPVTSPEIAPVIAPELAPETAPKLAPEDSAEADRYKVQGRPPPTPRPP